MNQKWSSKEIEVFWSLYQGHPILYDTHHPDYNNKIVRKEQLRLLLDRLNQSGLLIDEHNLKKRIKSLRDVYRAELNKVVISQERAGASVEDFYVPKLAWYDAADFLRPFATRLPYSHSELEAITLYEETVSDTDDGPDEMNHSRRESSSRKRNKKKFGYIQNTVDCQEVLEKVEEVQSKLEKRDENDAFGEYVAAELRKMNPFERAVIKKRISNVLHDFEIRKFTTEDSEKYSTSVLS